MKSNITPGIRERMGRNLHNTPNHPLEIIKKIIQDYFGDNYTLFDTLDPIVKVEDNFDKLLIPKTHPARSTSDTYYVDEENVLRTHTSAHQNDHLSKGLDKFLVTGDVYRKDEIDASHYPVFHQMEGVCLISDDTNPLEDLKCLLGGLIETLFDDCEYRWNDDYFPFTNPSLEAEVMYNGEWLEILGCGVIQPEILRNNNIEGTGWAFGLGLERLAMILFNIPDIRYFWSEDERFINQFKSGKIVEFVPYSKYPPSPRDIAMWINLSTYNYNNFCEIVREIGGDLVESIETIDEFVHPTTMRKSICYRIWYRSNDRTLTNEEVDVLQEQVRKEVLSLGVDVR